jgi:hypothetical protein
MTRSTCIILLWAALCVPVGLAGSISGVVTNPKMCNGIQALLRSGPGVTVPSKPKVYSGTLDRANGKFAIKNLPEGDYDLRLLVTGGRVDGVDMRLEEAEMDEEDEPFGKADEKQIRDFIANQPQAFMDVFRVIAIKGNSKYAKVIVEQIRVRPFHSGGDGDRIWRIDMWPFENQTGAWVRAMRGKRTFVRVYSFQKPVKLYRKKRVDHMLAEDFEPMVWQFSGDIGGIEVDEDAVVAGLKVTVPEINVKNGKVAGSVKKQAEEFHKKKKDAYLD